MADTTVTKENLYTKEGELVIPMDLPRSLDFNCNSWLSGSYTSGYLIQSGKVAYIKHFVATELSGHDDGKVWLTDEAGRYICPQLNLVPNTSVAWDPDFACGPIQSGIRIYNEGLYGRGTLIVQIDPQVIE